MNEFTHCLQPLTWSGKREIDHYNLPMLAESLGSPLDRVPFIVKILLEMMVRHQGHAAFRPEHVRDLAAWQPNAGEAKEFPFMPARVLLQDFTGVPCMVDLAAMRSALGRFGKSPDLIEPLVPVDLVIDHSVQVDKYLGPDAFAFNLQREFERNGERYEFLHWGQQAFHKVSVLPPGLGICHQVNMEYLGRCVTIETVAGRELAYPDSCVGTDSHTPMINSMGILGWGVGGIEAEAAMLGQPLSMLTPEVIGCRLVGQLGVGCTPTDLALQVTQTLRAKGVVGKFVEFFGSGLDGMTIADRAPLSNMTPEYGATASLFPVDATTLAYLSQTGRDPEQIALVEAYYRAQGMFRETDSPEAAYTDVVEIDLGALVPSVAGPKRPQDRLGIHELKKSFHEALTAPTEELGYGLKSAQLGNSIEAGQRGRLTHGSVVIAAITSCTNTSNPTLMIGAGLLARQALTLGLQVPDTVKMSFAPGSRVVTRYLEEAGLIADLDRLGFRVVAYGCTTCIGNSGPLLPEIENAISEADLVAAAVLSGNRNFEGRIHPLTRANYLASPLLVVAYALAGRMDIDLTTEPLGQDQKGNDVFLKDIWPSAEAIAEILRTASRPEFYVEAYANVMNESPQWSALTSATGPVFDFEPDSTYIQEPPFFTDFSATPPGLADLTDARVLGLFGDFITTDHISPAGSIAPDSPAARYLTACGVPVEDYNSYGSRRGNHEVMMRGTFANIRLRNQLVERVGGWTLHHDSGKTLPFFDAAMRYQADGVSSVILAGKQYGAGSSRDWAAKGTQLLGVRAVIAESFERIHRSNLVGMGVLPFEFVDGQSHHSLGLTGHERYTIEGLAAGLVPGQLLTAKAVGTTGETTFSIKFRADSALEVEYLRHGGILHYVLRQEL